MNRKTLLYLIAILLAIPSVLVKAEVDTLAWKRVFISEIKLVNQNPFYNFAYLELYNGSGKTVNMSDYWLQVDWNRIASGAKAEGNFKVVLNGTLEPGGTYLLTTVSDLSTALDPWGVPTYPNGYYHRDLLPMADFIGDYRDNNGGPHVIGSAVLNNSGRIGLFYRGDTSTVPGVVARDSVMVDRFQNDKNADNSDNTGIVAGVITGQPGWDYIHVRKANINKGEPDFDVSRGSNADDSEWIVLPRARMQSEFDKLFTTVGSHSNQTELVMTPNVPGITVNKDTEVITFPYGIRRDSLFRYFDFGPEHAWDLHIGNDTAQWFVSTGDTIDVIVCGNKATKFSFHAQVEAKSANFAKVRPAIIQNPDNGNWNRRYIVSDGSLPIDTIGGVAYSTHIDTLLTYLIVDGESHEFIFADGKDNVELKAGDKIKVTAGDQTKTYLISVDRYAPNHDATLSTVYMPGVEIWENPQTFEMTDTMLTFAPTLTNYVVSLPETYTQAPAIIAKATSNRAKVHIVRPSNLDGDDAARKAVITVTAEDDTTILVYNILFNVERETPPVIGEPFISEFSNGMTGGDQQNYQIFNPGDDPIDLGNYVFVIHESKSLGWGDFIDYGNKAGNSLFTDRANNKGINRHLLRPSYWVNADANGDCFYQVDANFPNAELYPKEVYSMVNPRGYPFTGQYVKNQSAEHKALCDKVDIFIGQRGPGDGQAKFPQTWGSGWYLTQKLGYDYAQAKADVTLFPYGSDMWLFAHNDWEKSTAKGNSFMLYKIKNDSVADGTKPINKNFLEDHELVDVLNGPGVTGQKWNIYDKTVLGVDTVYRFSNSGSGFVQGSMTRKPWVYSGNTEELGAFGNKNREGEWEVFGILADGTYSANDVPGVCKGARQYGSTLFENHLMITYAHIPYITSQEYLIGKGLDGIQPILGVAPNTTVDQFMSKINKADTGMVVALSDAGGNLVAGADIIQNNYKVRSTSATRQNSVDYQITVGILSNNTTLTAKSGSGLVIEGNVIKNVPFGWTIKRLMDNVVAPVTAKTAVTDGNEMLIPMEMYNADTNLVQQKLKVDVLASSEYVVEVLAQNSVDVAEYAIEFADENSVYVISNVYEVVEAVKTLNYVYMTSVEAFLSNVIASPGATMSIINSISQKREDGLIQYDDRLVVEKGDVKVLYRLKFTNDDRWQVKVPEVKNAITAAVYPNPTTGSINLSGLSTDNVITVRNLAGQLVATYNVVSTDMNINLAGSAGVYFVTVQNTKSKTQVSYKVIKE